MNAPTRADADRALLEVDDLVVRFGDVDAVRGVSFHVDPGEIVALVGESGSGKSVSALSVVQLLTYPHASHPPRLDPSARDSGHRRV